MRLRYDRIYERARYGGKAQTIQIITQNGKVERSNWAFKYAVSQVGKAEQTASPSTIIARSSFFSILSYYFKPLSAFQLARSLKTSIPRCARSMFRKRYWKHTWNEKLHGQSKKLFLQGCRTCGARSSFHPERTYLCFTTPLYKAR